MPSHDEILARVRRALSNLAVASIADAFVASLGSAPLRYRSTLNSWAKVALMPDHEFADLGDNSGCAICGVRPDVPEGERELIDGKESGTCLGYPEVYAALVDLEHFQTLDAVTPNERDQERLRQAVTAAIDLPEKGRATDYVKALRGLGKSPTERETIAATLAAVGVLRSPDQPAMTERWTSYWERNESPNLATELEWPLRWWRAEHGINADALATFFPGLGLEVQPRPAETFSSDAHQCISLPAVRGKRPRLSLAPGDLLAIVYEPHVFLGTVQGTLAFNKKLLPVIEFRKGVFDQVPTPEFLYEQPARMVGPFASGDRWRREPVAIDGLELFGKTWPGNVHLLGRDDGVAPPEPNAHLPRGCRVVEARNLVYFTKQLRTETLLPGPEC